MGWIKVFAPATVANLGPGFDVLGLAIDNLGDTIQARKIESGIIISEITGDGHLPFEAEKNTAGIAAAKKQAKLGFTPYKKPTRVLKIWMNNQRIAKKKSIAIKYAKFTHTSIKRGLKEFPYIKMILSKHKEISRELKLSQEELDYLKEN